jgi:hypothetical protein
MTQAKASDFSSPILMGWLAILGIAILVCSIPIYVGLSLGYTESKGPFKNWIQVVDLDNDGDRDMIVSHTRSEDVDLSWAGTGRWINQGNGKFSLILPDDLNHFGGASSGAGDVDQDGDPDVFTQIFAIYLNVNQGGLQGGEPGVFRASGGINTPPAYNSGYRDMGGTITLGDLNGDGWSDAFVAGCCYGLNPTKRGYEYPNAPSVSWVWINDGVAGQLHKGHILPMDSLDGVPIRQAALGDLDGDGDLDVFAAVGVPTMGSYANTGDLILRNDGSGNLTVNYQPMDEADSTSVALGDVNGDGRLDALVGTPSGGQLLMNQGSEPESGGEIFIPAEQRFKAVQTIWEKLQAGISAAASRLSGLYLPYGSTRTKAVFLEDLDCDGDLDALIARLFQAEIWWNDGQGVFSRAEVDFDYQEDTGVAVADFDGDQDADIFAGSNQDNYQLWWNDGKGIYFVRE